MQAEEVELQQLRSGDVFEEVSYGVAHYQVLTDPVAVDNEMDQGIELWAWDMDTGQVIRFFEGRPGFLDLTRLIY